MRCLLAAVAILAAGCPGRISSPERFTDATLAFSCETSMNVQEDIVRPRCANAGCHSAAAPAGELDLASPGVALRMYGQQASACGDEVLLDPKNPFGGYFFDKLTETKPRCGARMPLSEDPLSAEEIACVHRWLAEELAAAAAR